MAAPAEMDRFKKDIVALPVGKNVLGNEFLAGALGPTRQRDMSVVGTVIEYDWTRLRVGINWAPDPLVEYLAPKYLTPIGD